VIAYSAGMQPYRWFSQNCHELKRQPIVGIPVFAAFATVLGSLS
jgi:hypothetical protein